MNTYKSPWGVLLTIITVTAVIILLGVITSGIIIRIKDYQILWYLVMIVIPSSVLIVTLIFMVRKYEIRERKLLVHRLGWKKIIDLSNLKSAEADPKAVKNSIRLFGNGGLFAFSGIYRNKELGNYNVFATDFKKCVVLKTDQKIFVISPDNPKKFVEDINRIINN